jgi:hypothetical protein
VKARGEADAFLEAALSVADPNLQALAWEVNARVARAEREGRKARECINHALAATEHCESPLTGWVVHRTAWDICIDEGDRERAAQHRALSKKLILGVADSFDREEPLRECFLRNPQIRRVLEEATSA